MSADAIARVTAVLQNRLAAAIGAPVYVGAPIAEDVGTRRLSLYLYQVVPNQALRNERHYVAPAGDTDGPLVETQALPLDLHYLVSAFRSAALGGMGDADELVTLGQVVQALHQEPLIDGAQVPDQLVRITPEPYTVEELNRIWGLFPESSHRPSVVYLLSPVSVALDPPLAGPPVRRRTSRQGPFTERVPS